LIIYQNEHDIRPTLIICTGNRLAGRDERRDQDQQDVNRRLRQLGQAWRICGAGNIPGRCARMKKACRLREFFAVGSALRRPGRREQCLMATGGASGKLRPSGNASTLRRLAEAASVRDQRLGNPPRMDVVSADRPWMDTARLDQISFGRLVAGQAFLHPTQGRDWGR
jgi:hypothetical protein